MFCLCRNSQLPKLFIKVVHEFRNLRLEHTEVVIFHLLSFRSGGSHQSSSAEQKILPLHVHFLVDKEVFLLGTDSGGYTGNISISEKMKDFNSLF